MLEIIQYIGVVLWIWTAFLAVHAILVKKVYLNTWSLPFITLIGTTSLFVITGFPPLGILGN